MKKKLRIVLVDDHRMVRQTWKLLLQSNEDLDIIAECSNGEEAINISRELNPDIILMDINMTPVNGFEATKMIVESIPGAKIIGMSINNLASYARNLINLGAKGYVTKHSAPDEMVKAIMEVAKGHTYICTEIKNKMSADNEDDFRILPGN